MDIDIRQQGKKWLAEVWEDLNEMQEHDTFSEERYNEINKWCIDTLGYHARTAYHIFEFRDQSHLEWFILRWQ